MTTNLDEHREILRTAARRYARKYHWDREEMLSCAYVIYAETVRDWRPRRGAFDHFLRVRLRRLADEPRRVARRLRLARFVDAVLDELPGPRGRPALGVLGPDAAAVARLALASRPMEAVDARGALRRYFSALWGPSRYRRAVQEILEFLE